MSASQRAAIPALTGLRAYAAFWVVAFHLRAVLGDLLPDGLADVAARGYLGVDLFFVLSGFLIARNYGGQIGTLGDYGAFLRRRLGRIYPLHIFTLMLLVLGVLVARAAAGGVLDGPTRPFDQHLLWHVLMVHAWGVTNQATWNLPSWSVSAEWFAYLSFPLTWWAVSRVHTNAAALVGVVCACGSTVVALIFLGEDSLHTRLDLRLVRLVGEFVAGAFVAQVSGEGRPRARMLALLAAMALAAWSLFGWTDWPWPIAACLIVYGLSGDKGAGALAFSSRPVIWLGEISYSVYLVHLPLLALVHRAFVVVSPGEEFSGLRGAGFVATYLLATVIASWLAYRLVEAPARAWSRR